MKRVVLALIVLAPALANADAGPTGSAQPAHAPQVEQVEPPPAAAIPLGGGDRYGVNFGGPGRRHSGPPAHRHCPRYFCGSFYTIVGGDRYGVNFQDHQGEDPHARPRTGVRRRWRASGGLVDRSSHFATITNIDARARPGTRGTRRCRHVVACDALRDRQRSGRVISHRLAPTRTAGASRSRAGT
jgi:hypothetical protein